MIQRKKCPQCQARLPLFMFRADRKVSANKDFVIFLCPHCKTKLKAISNEAHQNNFIWVVLGPLLFSVVLISLHGFIPSYIRPVYYFLGFMLCLMYFVLKGQHGMDIELAEGGAENSSHGVD